MGMQSHHAIWAGWVKGCCTRMGVYICYSESLGQVVTAKRLRARDGSNQSGWLVGRAAIEVDLEMVVLGQSYKLKK
jgi:hypothetical protein